MEKISGSKLQILNPRNILELDSCFRRNDKKGKNVVARFIGHKCIL